MADAMVRMAEMAIATSDTDVLVALGLGSCIGLALVNRQSRCSALAHIVLPSSRESNGPTSGAKFADLAVPELVRKLASHRGGGQPVAILVGGAHMFSVSPTTPGLDIGNRNAEAVRQALAKLGIRVTAAVTGGAVGRTVRVYNQTGVVTCRESGTAETAIYTPGAAAVAA